MTSGLDEMVSDARAVIRDVETCGGVPILEGTRIRVSDVVVAYDHHELTPEEIVGEFPRLEIQDVHSALAYYHSHPAVIRSEIEEREETFDQAR